MIRAATAMSPSARRMMLTVCAMTATIMQALDTTVANVALPFTLPAPLSGGVLQISDAGGNVVGRVPLGTLPGGARTYTLQPGQPPLAAGTYRYQILGPGATGALAPLPVISGVVSGVKLDNGTPVLSLGSVNVALTDLTSVGSTK